MSDSHVTGQEQCPECAKVGGDTSGDNLAVFSDGHTHCFACGHHTPPTGSKRTTQKPKEHSMFTPLIEEAEYRVLRKREISEETCRFFGYQVGKYSGKTAQIANYKRGGEVVAQKVRTAGKEFKFLGDAKRAGLYGMHLWRDGGKRLVITEGEIDALSVSQLQRNKWPVVSVPNGAQGAAKSIAQEIEWVEKFDAVVFAFDMDDPGQKAAKECASMLTPGKALIAHLPLKDANECLVKGKGAALISALWEAKAFRPDGVVDVMAVFEKAREKVVMGLDWPWPTLTSATYGRRRGELYGFGGGTGCGKSTVFKQVALHIMENDKLPVGMFMLEESAAHTLRTLAGMSMRKRVHVPGVEYKQDDYEKTLLSLNNHVYFYDHFGSSNWATIKEKIKYMVLSLGIKDIFLDHLTALAASIDGDERRAIDKIMEALSSLCQELDATIYYISHLSSPEGKPHEEGGRVLEKHFRGSRSIGYWTHFMFAIERNKQDIGGVTTFRVLKDRYTGDGAGVTFGLEYSRETGLLNECPIPSDDDSDSPFENASADSEF